MAWKPVPCLEGDAREILCQVEHTTGRVFGVLHEAPNASSAVILVPASTGTRIGPQRLYVQVARQLAQAGIAALRMDLATSGDSMFEGPPPPSELTLAQLGQIVDLTLAAATRCLTSHGLDTLAILTISQCCLPALDFAKRHAVKTVVMLSPNFFQSAPAATLKSRVREYGSKLCDRESWNKLLARRAHPAVILSNLLEPLRRTRMRSGAECAQMYHGSEDVEIIVICGERDQQLRAVRAFWKDRGAARVRTVREFVVAGSDHSFFGWEFKEAVSSIVTKSLVAHG